MAPIRPLNGNDERFDERGSILVVLGVLTVVLLLSVALISRVSGDFHNVNNETNLEQARSLAQSGVADALFQIDQKGSSPANFCNAPSVCGALTNVPGAPGAKYTAQYSAATNTYKVLSQGTVRNQSYAVQATLERSSAISDGAFGALSFTFDGKNDSIAATDPYGNPIPGAKVYLGSQGTLTCNGQSDPNVVYVTYGSGSASGCTPLEELSTPYSPQPPSQSCPAAPNSPPTPCLPSGASSCLNMSPGKVTLNGGVYTVNGPATIEPGIYLCQGGLTFAGTVKVDYAQTPLQNSGRVEVFVFPAASGAQPSVSLQGANVNQCETTSGTGPSTNGCNGGLLGDPVDLQIYAAGSGAASLGGGISDAIFWGPGMNMTLDGNSGSLNWTGSIILGQITANGNVSFNLNYDQRIQNEYQTSNWQITNYVQIDPNFAIPGF